MKSPKLSKDSNGYWDLKITDGKFEWSEDGEQLAQHGMFRLNTFKGEYTLNGMLPGRADEGTRYYETIFQPWKTEAEKQLEIKRRIFIAGVTGLKDFTWEKSGRAITVTGTVETIYGDIALTESEVTPL